MDKTHITVFVTKTLKFRAEIEEPGKPNYEVTVGGKNWQSGVGRKHEAIIRRKVISILEKLVSEATTMIKPKPNTK